MEDSRPIFFYKRFSHNENALYYDTSSKMDTPPIKMHRSHIVL